MAPPGSSELDPMKPDPNRLLNSSLYPSSMKLASNAGQGVHSTLGTSSLFGSSLLTPPRSTSSLLGPSTLSSSSLLGASSLLGKSSLLGPSSLTARPSLMGSSSFLTSPNSSKLMSSSSLLVSPPKTGFSTAPMTSYSSFYSNIAGDSVAKHMDTLGAAHGLKQGDDPKRQAVVETDLWETESVKSSVMQMMNKYEDIDIELSELSKMTAKCDAAPYLANDPQVDKLALLDFLSSCMLVRVNVEAAESEKIVTLRNRLKAVEARDPEFILKAALYARQDLQLRTLANYVLAYAACSKECAPFVKKYFAAATQLPSDCLEILDLLKGVPNERNLKPGSIPSSMRRPLTAKFATFSEFHLAKYNKEKARLRKGKPSKAPVKGRRPVVTKQTPIAKPKSNDRIRPWTLKRLVRVLHIRKPVDSVMKLLGKKYPDTSEKFYETGLSGTFEVAKAGKRMKLDTPITWETQVALRGNKAAVWESLIDDNKLPYMATLRNIRNLLQAGVSEEHHSKVIKKLKDEKQVIRSRQFPFRFFSAYDVLDEVEANGITVVKKVLSRNKKRGGKVNAKFTKEAKHGHEKYIARYTAALGSALQTATRHNCAPIHGKTVLFVNVDNDGPVNDSGYGKRTSLEVSLLLAAMFTYSCEDANVVFYSQDPRRSGVHRPTNSDKSKNLLELVADWKDLLKTRKSPEPSPEAILDMWTSTDATEQAALKELRKFALCPEYDLIEMTLTHEKFDNMILLNGCNDRGPSIARLFAWRKEFLQLQGGLLLFAGCADVVSDTVDDALVISGFSDTILRFVAEQSNNARVLYVENLDSKYGLDNTVLVPRMPFAVEGKLPKVLRRERVFKVFISSTFADMVAERHLIARYIWPRLQQVVRSRGVGLELIDLRWGVDHMPDDNVQLCLEAATKADLFICVLGARRGYMPPPAVMARLDERFRVEKDLYLTELELVAACEKNAKNCIVFLRNGATREILKRVADTSVCRKAYSAAMVPTAEPPHEPLATELDDFANQLSSSVLSWVEENERSAVDVDATFRDMQLLTVRNAADAFASRQQLLKDAAKAVWDVKTGVCLLTGRPGCGKSSLLAALTLADAPTLGRKPQPRDDRIIQLIYVKEPFEAPLSSVTLMLELSQWLLTCTQVLEGPVPNADSLNELIAFWHRLLVEVSRQKFVVRIFVDGVDELVRDKLGLAWLPNSCPENVSFVLAVSSEGAAFPVLNKHVQKSNFVVTPLQVAARADVVTKILARYHKSLSASAFKNQMSLLTQKKDAALPAYLALALEELNMDGDHDTLSLKLRQMPVSFAALGASILQRIEEDFPKDVVKTAFVLLMLSPAPLPHSLLRELLGRAFAVGGSAPKRSVLMAAFLKVLAAIAGFAGETKQGIVITNSTSRAILSERYLEKLPFAQFQYYHGIFASTYFESLTNNKAANAYDHLPRHAFYAGDFKLLENLLTGLQFFVLPRLQSNCPAEVYFADYDLAHPLPANASRPYIKEVEIFRSSEPISHIRRLILSNLNVLMREPLASLCSLVRNDNYFSSHSLNEPFVLEVTKCQARVPPVKMLAANTSLHSIAVSPSGQLTACGDSDGVVYLYKTNTLILQRLLVGHAGPVLGLDFVSDSRLVSVGADAVLCAWDADTGARTKCSTDLHQRRINHVAVSTSARSIATAGDDNLVCIISLKTGKREQQLTESSPVSSLAFHPSKLRLATALWDGTASIWDTLKGTRIGRLRRESRSMSALRCITYSPNGDYLAIGAVDGSLTLFDAVKGRCVTSLNEGVVSCWRPINAIAFSPDNKNVMTGREDGTIEVVKSHTGRLEECVELKMAMQAVAVAVSDADVYHYHCATRNGKIYIIIDGAKPKLFFDSKGRHSYSAIATVTPDICFAGCRDGCLHVITSSGVASTATSRSLAITCLSAALENGQIYVHVGMEDGGLYIYSLARDKSMSDLKLGSTWHLPGGIMAIGALYGSSLSLWASSRDNMAHHFAMKSTKMEMFKMGKKDSVEARGVTGFSWRRRQQDNPATFDTDVAICSNDGKMRVCTKDFDVVTTVQCDYALSCVDMIKDSASDSGHVLAGTSCGKILLWTKSGCLVTMMSVSDSPILLVRLDTDHCVVFDEEGRMAKYMLFEKNVVTSMHGHQAPVTDLFWLAGGSVESTGLDGTCLRWEPPTGAVPPSLFDGPVRSVSILNGVLWATDGKRISATWQLPSGEVSQVHIAVPKLSVLYLDKQKTVGELGEGKSFVTAVINGEDSNLDLLLEDGLIQKRSNQKKMPPSCLLSPVAIFEDVRFAKRSNTFSAAVVDGNLVLRSLISKSGGLVYPLHFKTTCMDVDKHFIGLGDDQGNVHLFARMAEE